MKFRVLGIILVFSLIFACGFTVSGEQNRTAYDNFTSKDNNDILFARVENMLSHNFVYNDDFDSTTVMVDNSMLALINNADEDGFIDASLVEGFVYNMYGITLSEYAVNIDFPQKDGYIYLLPRGYDEFHHNITEIKKEDNYLYVDSVMTILTHEGYNYEYNCLTMLEKTDASAFGYIIVSSLYY